jgi:hypothetical protein
VRIEEAPPAFHDGEGGPKTFFNDHFLIRAWTPEQVLGIADRCGFELVEDLSDQFAGSGSDYYLLSTLPRG